MKAWIAIAGMLASSAAYATPVERRLHSNEVEASSFLWNDWNRFVENYHPNYVADDDPVTAWVEGAPGSGAGEWLLIHTTPVDKTTRVRVRVRNGYQKSAALYAANARMKTATITLLPSKVLQHVTFKDDQGWQEFTIDQPSGVISGVQIHADSVFEGKRYEDMCVSDVQIFATSEVLDNPALEKHKHDELLAWRAQRVALAKQFANKRPDVPFAASYVATAATAPAAMESYYSDLGKLAGDAAKDPALAKDFADALAIAHDQLGAGLDKLTPAQLAPTTSTKLVEVDGLQLLDDDKLFSPEAQSLYDDHALRLPTMGTVAAMFADQLRVLDVKTGALAAPTTWAAQNGKCAANSTAWVGRIAPRDGGGPAAVRVVVVGRCGRIETRDGHEDVRTLEAMIYGADGKLAFVVGNNHLEAYRWGVDNGKPIVIGGHSVLIADGTPSAIEIARRPEVAAATPPAKP